MSKSKTPGITGKSSEVDIDSIEGNGWNPNVQSDFKFEQTKKVIREFGFLDPCTVRTGREKGKLFKKPQIIDGEHRWKAAKDVGMTAVSVMDVGRMSDAKAKVLTDILNNLRGENDPMKWLEMVQSVQEADEDMLQFLPYQSEELEAMMASNEVDWSSFDKGNPDDSKRDENGELYKKFSVSLSTATMARVQDLMRKVKAAKGVDDDAAAFEAILAGFEAHVASKATKTDEDPAPDDGPTPRRRRRRASKAA